PVERAVACRFAFDYAEGSGGRMDANILERAVLDRRRLLQFGGAGCLGLTLGGLLRAQSAISRPEARIRSCVVVFHYGGPSHLDTFDLKPNAPSEVRGEFRPIATSAP